MIFIKPFYIYEYAASQRKSGAGNALISVSLNARINDCYSSLSFYMELIFIIVALIFQNHMIEVITGICLLLRSIGQ